MMPGPPPVITGMPALASSRAVSTAASYSGSSGLVRAEPKIDTPSLHIRQVVETPDELAHDPEHPPGVRDQKLFLIVALLRLRPSRRVSSSVGRLLSSMERYGLLVIGRRGES